MYIYTNTCASAGACARLRGSLGAHVSAPNRAASPLSRRGPRVARLAGVPVGVGVQGEHRRVEHRVDILVGLGIRRFGPGRCVFDAARPLCARTVYIDITAHRSEIYVSSFLCCTCVASSFGVSPVRKRARALAGARADARTDLHSTLYRVIRIVNVTFYRYGCKERASCTRTCRIGNTRIEQTCMHRLRDNIHAHLCISRN